MEVLRLMAKGLGNLKIAERLGLSRHTVKNHVHNILERLGVKDRTEAVAYAYRHRWLEGS
jgi:NarL family two-component system response regulator LiaR